MNHISNFPGVTMEFELEDLIKTWTKDDSIKKKWMKEFKTRDVENIEIWHKETDGKIF